MSVILIDTCEKCGDEIRNCFPGQIPFFAEKEEQLPPICPKCQSEILERYLNGRAEVSVFQYSTCDSKSQSHAK